MSGLKLKYVWNSQNGTLYLNRDVTTWSIFWDEKHTFSTNNRFLTDKSFFRKCNCKHTSFCAILKFKWKYTVSCYYILYFVYRGFNSRVILFSAPTVALKNTMSTSRITGKENAIVNITCSAVGGYPRITQYNLSIFNQSFVQVCSSLTSEYCKLYIHLQKGCQILLCFSTP